MADLDDTSGGFSVLDGAALVAGAAVAAAHIRRAIDPSASLGMGWMLLWGTFFWIAVTAAGPFIFVVRRWVRVSKGYPRIGDGLWAMLGIPWLVTAVSGNGRDGGGTHYLLGLGVGVSLASMVAMGVVWSRWVVVSPEEAARTFSRGWTNRVGLVLAVAWPIQCGVGMVVVE